MKEEAIAELESGEVIIARFMMTQMMKLRQIASGFAYTGEDPELISNGKMKEIESLLEEIDGKVIIFCCFTFMKVRITSALNREKIQAINFEGSTKEAALNAFEKHDNIKVLVANPASAGHGLNLQFCSNIIYAEHDFNLEYYEQSMQRIERIGQKNKMTVYHIITKNTVENYIMRQLQNKIDVNKNIDISKLKEML